MAVYEHDLDAANARIEELETELAETKTNLRISQDNFGLIRNEKNVLKAELADAVAAAQAVQKTCDKLRAENVALTAGKTQGAEAAAKVAANLAAFSAGEL